MLTGVNELIKFMHARLEEAHEKAPTVHAVASAMIADAAATCDCGMPDQIRRDIAAKQRIFEDYRITVSAVRRTAAADLAAPALDSMRAGRDALASVARLLAEPFKDHQDYPRNP